MVPMAEGRGLKRWVMVSGMLIAGSQLWACTGFPRGSVVSCFSFLSLDRAVNVFLMSALGNLNVHPRGCLHVFPYELFMELFVSTC